MKNRDVVTCIRRAYDERWARKNVEVAAFVAVETAFFPVKDLPAFKEEVEATRPGWEIETVAGGDQQGSPRHLARLRLVCWGDDKLMDDSEGDISDLAAFLAVHAVSGESVLLYERGVDYFGQPMGRVYEFCEGSLICYDLSSDRLLPVEALQGFAPEW